MLVAGIDSSTQSTKVVLCDAADGTVVGRGSAPHPDGTECDPAHWWEALRRAGRGLLRRAAAVGVAAQQHGMVVLDETGKVIRPALLWNDLRSAAQARDLIAERGGPGWWAAETGSVPTPSFTVTKLRWLAEHEPASAARVTRVVLPHDWLSWRLRGGSDDPVTDRGDASGTGSFAVAESRWLPDLAAGALGHQVRLPRVAAPAEVTGETSWRAAVAAGTGDNMGSARGPATSWSPSAPRALRPRSATRLPPMSRARWRALPTPPGGSCRWSAPSTRPGCWTPRHGSSAPVQPGSRNWRSARDREPAASRCCPTWTASGPRTGRRRPAC